MKRPWWLLPIFLWNCRGPAPEVRGLKLLPDRRDPTRQWVELVIANERGGEGEARVVVRLRSPETKLTLQKVFPVELRPGDQVLERVHFPLVPGHFVPEAEVKYPP